MAADDDKKLHEKIGFMRADIKNIGDKVDKVVDQTAEINTALITLNGSTVKKVECSAHTKDIAAAVNSLKLEINKKQTRQPSTPPATLDSDQLETSGVFRVPTQPPATLPLDSFAKRVKDNIGAILAVLTLLGVLIVGSVKLSHFVVNLEKVLKDNSKEQVKASRALKKEIKDIKDDPPRVIYVRMPSDAGPMVGPRRPRRR